ncbi:hypothetical protein [Kineococcus indalonis]|uniref:hypothetical protein n=1 Tax=Kineococcus indalonis TaxID=2696566 RepID=UPI0014125153|nr:hypothetical protein [Kineococcus indalonis]NAZ87806.1 hypothetical protein [Kineococcus indalonis]
MTPETTAGPVSLLGRHRDDPAVRAFLGPSRALEWSRLEGTTHAEAPDLGVELILPGHEVVSTVVLHGPDVLGQEAYAGPLPAGLRFRMGREDVRALLGAPTRSAELGVLPALGLSPAWDRYDSPGHRVHVQYGLNLDHVRRVSLSLPRP